MYSCGGVEERKGCDGDVAARVAHAVAPVRAPSVYCYGGERSVYYYGGA